MPNSVDAVLQAQNHPNILPCRVFVLGHSLGAVVAPLIDRGYGCFGDRLCRHGWACGASVSMSDPTTRYIQSLYGPESANLDARIEEAQKQADLADSDRLTSSTTANLLPFGIAVLLA